MTTRKRDNERLFRRAKLAGLTAEEVWATVSGAIETAAREQGWRPSERAAALADRALAIRRTYGKAATRFLFPDENGGAS